MIAPLIRSQTGRFQTTTLSEVPVQSKHTATIKGAQRCFFVLSAVSETFGRLLRGRDDVEGMKVGSGSERQNHLARPQPTAHCHKLSLTAPRTYWHIACSSGCSTCTSTGSFSPDCNGTRSVSKTPPSVTLSHGCWRHVWGAVSEVLSSHFSHWRLRSNPP